MKSSFFLAIIKRLIFCDMLLTKSNRIISFHFAGRLFILHLNKESKVNIYRLEKIIKKNECLYKK